MLTKRLKGYFTARSNTFWIVLGLLICCFILLSKGWADTTSVMVNYTVYSAEIDSVSCTPNPSNQSVYSPNEPIYLTADCSASTTGGGIANLNFSPSTSVYSSNNVHFTLYSLSCGSGGMLSGNSCLHNGVTSADNSFTITGSSSIPGADTIIVSGTYSTY